MWAKIRAFFLTTAMADELAEHRQAAATLRESDARYRTLLEHIPAVTYLIGLGQEPLNPTIYVSPQIEKVTGHTSAEFLDNPLLWIELLHPDDRARIMAESERTDQTGESAVGDYRIMDKDQKILWIHDENMLVKDDQGQPLYRLGVWTEITEHKQSELARQQTEELYRRAIMVAGAVPYVLDHATRTFTFIGKGILPITGYSAAEMMSSNPWNTMVLEGFPRGDLAHLTYEEADRLTEADNSIPWECDFRIRTRDGQIRWIADTSVKNFDETSGHMLSIGIKQDITARKAAEEKIRQLNETLEARVIERTAQLEAANRELEAFSYSVSHDLRSPLRAINGFAKILDEDFSAELSPPAQGFLRKIRASGEKMGLLIDGLLDFSRLGRRTLVKQAVDLNELVRQVIESLAPETANRQIEWILAGLPSPQADPTLIQPVFANLLGNAVKYTGKCAVARIEVGSLLQNGETVYFVGDNGVGFDMQYAAKLFGVFQRLHREEEFEGTGIGLATVQRIIQRHGGRIWAEAEVGKGATFYFTLGEK